MAGWDDGIFGNLPPRYMQPATPGAQPPVLTDDGSAWPQAQQGAPSAAQGQGSGYWWPKILQGLWNTARSGATLPGDVATGRASMADPATQGRVGDMATLATLGAGAAPAEPDALNIGIRAYHGSPYNFDRFDISKIGTGEGAHAYGHGLYFAGNPEVADRYARVVTANQPGWHGVTPPAFDSLSPGELAKIPDEMRGRIAASWQNNGEDVARNLAVKMFENSRGTDYSDALHTLAYGAEWSPPGHRYQVNINADPGQFLDWDKPLSEQPAGQKILAGQRLPLLPPSMTGQQLAKFYGLDEKGADKLASLGVPGIKYLDQGSRGAGGEGGTQNYVTFSDDIINILKKYGLTGLGLTAGAGALATQHPSAAQAASGMTLGGGR